MANQLDLEEQEQLDQLKHFWNQYGNLITWVLVAVLASVASWNGYHYWKRSQAAQSAAMFDEMGKSVAGGDLAKAQRTFTDMQDRYAGSTYTHQAGLALAKMAADAANLDAAKAALQWVAEKANDEGYAAVARLRLANIYVDTKAYPEALKTLDGVKNEAFDALVADRKGDVLLLQDKKTEAKEAYLLAFKKLSADEPYQRLLLVKLNALGVDPQVGAGLEDKDGSKGKP
ncbi:MAG: tetratricopeptide repeat protein [Betaproteobacteria bacterium]